MFKRIPGNVEEDSRECSRVFREIFQKIPGNAEEDSMWAKIIENTERFIMQLNENRIKAYILKYIQKCAQKFIKTSHVNEHV